MHQTKFCEVLLPLLNIFKIDKRPKNLQQKSFLLKELLHDQELHKIFQDFYLGYHATLSVGVSLLSGSFSLD